MYVTHSLRNSYHVQYRFITSKQNAALEIDLQSRFSQIGCRYDDRGTLLIDKGGSAFSDYVYVSNIRLELDT